MNRTEQPLHPIKQPSATSEIDSALFSAPSCDTASAVFAPLHYEPGYAYPLIVWLHGRGGDERQLTRVMPLVSMRNYAAVAPRGTCFPEANGPVGAGYGWEQSQASIQQAAQRVFDGIEAARERLHIARQRVFLAGFDCGGTMAFRVAMNHPRHFAGVLSLCGAFPRDHAPFGNLTEARRLPVLLAVGRDSREYPTPKVCEDLRLFHSAGLSVTLRQYPCGHELASQMLADMDRWIIEQITSGGRQAVESDHHWRCETD